MTSLNPDRRFLLTHIQFDKPILRARGHHLYDDMGDAYLMAEHRILTAPAFNHSSVLRIEPSLTITAIEIARVLIALEDIVRLLTSGDYARLFEYITGTREYADGNDRPDIDANLTEGLHSHGYNETARAMSR